MDATTTQTKLASFQARCRAAGLKLTPQRLAIYRALLETRDHPSAEALHRQLKPAFPSLSLDTVNRNLLTLADMGAAFVVEGTGEPKRFDGNTDSHQHFRCVKCKRIVDFHHEPFDNVPVPESLKQGFRIQRKTVYFEGICDRCTEPS